MIKRPKQVWLAIVVGVVATGCGAPEGLARLEDLDERAIAYPASAPLASGGYDAEQTMDGPQPAATWKIYGTGATPEEVIQYFRDEMGSRGWIEVPGIPSTADIDAVQWRRDDLALRLGIMDVDEWHQRIEGSDRYPTMYEVRVSERRDTIE